MRQSRVYVVDDDASVRKGLARVLEALGHAVKAYADGASFLESVEPDAPSCVLLDACLPGMPGLDVLASLRNRRIDIPVVFMTGRPEVSTCVRAMKEGVVDFLLKPLHKDDLVASIRTAHLLSVNRQRARNESVHAGGLLARLTVRERQVLALVLEGRRNKEIAATLDSQEATVKVHRSRLMRKLGVRSVPDLMRIGACGNLAALVQRDREAPEESGTVDEAYDVAGAGDNAANDDPPDAPSTAESAWRTANGTWSGFTWTSRA